VAGFTSGDGSFHFNVKTLEAKKGSSFAARVSLRFSINLHIRELEVIKGLANFFKSCGTEVPLCGSSPDSGIATAMLRREVLDKDLQYYNYYAVDKSVALQITKLSDIVNTVIPFFEKYPICGVKSLDFANFKEVANMITNKEHLAEEGYNRILEIKSNMNRERLW
jgi:hypothetical protein